jgi:hypothetical protein
MVFVKILGKGRRRKEGGRISILRSARGKLIALKKTFNLFFSLLYALGNSNKECMIYIGLDDDLWQNFVIECMYRIFSGIPNILRTDSKNQVISSKP